jgi:hypothetical protein
MGALNLYTNIQKYRQECILFNEPMKNSMKENSNFIQIKYSTESITLNGIYIGFELYQISCEKYFNKYKCWFSTQPKNIEIVRELIDLEKNILHKYSMNVLSTKIPQYKMKDMLSEQFLKLFMFVPKNNVATFVLKISGLWETETLYGLTFKFCYVDKIFNFE